MLWPEKLLNLSLKWLQGSLLRGLGLGSVLSWVTNLQSVFFFFCRFDHSNWRKVKACEGPYLPFISSLSSLLSFHPSPFPSPPSLLSTLLSLLLSSLSSFSSFLSSSLLSVFVLLSFQSSLLVWRSDDRSCWGWGEMAVTSIFFL